MADDAGPPRVSFIPLPRWLLTGVEEAIALTATPVVTDAAQTTRTPAAEMLDAIDTLISAAMQEALRGEHDQARKLLHLAIDGTIKTFGIDVSAVGTGPDGRPRIVYAGLAPNDAYGGYQKDGSITVYVDALLKGGSSARFLGGILVHEVTHARQAQAHGWPDPGQNLHAMEYMAHGAPLRDENLGLEPVQRLYFEQMAERHRSQLTAASLEKVEGSGQYWGL